VKSQVTAKKEDEGKKATLNKVGGFIKL